MDLTIRKGSNFANSGLFETEIHYKDTNHFSFIHGTSFHPKHTYKAIGKGEAIRILRACSSSEDFKKHMSHLIKRLRILHFPRRAIAATRAVTYDLRSKYLSPSPKSSSKRIFFLTKYCFHKPALHSIFTQHWLAMSSDPIIDKYFPSPPCLTYSNHRNFKSLFSRTQFHTQVSSTLPPSEFNLFFFKQLPLGSSLCDNKYCNICIRLSKHHFIITIFPINLHLTCSASNIIYVLSCQLCSKQYVDFSSLNLRQSFATHLRNFSTGSSLPLYSHFKRSHQIDSFKVNITLVTRVHPSTAKDQALAWIYKLQTQFPFGLNKLD